MFSFRGATSDDGFTGIEAVKPNLRFRHTDQTEGFRLADDLEAFAGWLIKLAISKWRFTVAGSSPRSLRVNRQRSLSAIVETSRDKLNQGWRA